ncbi:MAG TPA: DUF4157 domain-containing protein [Silvibacterium sp.]|jgi:hypothetical protein|nr:DUF4157 domain-containing protein [Silvibacterium sp.]
MLARKIAEAQAKSADNATGTPQRSTRPARQPDASMQRDVAWDFNKIPLLTPDRLQPKLKVGAVDDPLEREADRVADQAIRQTDSAASTSPPSTNHAKESSADRSEIESRVVEHGLTGGGEPLSASLRAKMEPRLGFDFGRIRIHTNSSASRSAERLSANAYALGADIVFRSGAYAPGSTDGKWLLAHELTHIAQQGAAARFAQMPFTRSAGPSAPAAQLISRGNSRVVQKDEAAGASLPSRDLMTPDYSQMTWQQLLPRAHGANGARITKIDLHTPENKIDAWAREAAPTLNYAKGKDTDTRRLHRKAALEEHREQKLWV